MKLRAKRDSARLWPFLCRLKQFRF